MEEKVVVGVTDATASQRAVDWAAERAVDRDEALVLLTVIGGSIGAVGSGEVAAEATNRAQARLDAQAERVRARGVEVETRVVRGDPVEELADASRGAALLVIGSDYRGAGSRRERGPHGIRITAAAHCPVAVVPDFDVTERTGVVVGVDGSTVSEAAIRFAAAEADRCGEPLTAIMTWSPVAVPLGALSDPGGAQQSLRRQTEEALATAMEDVATTYPGLDVRLVAESSDRPETVINEHAARARLAVIGSHGRGPVARFILGSTSEHVLERLATATVVVR